MEMYSFEFSCQNIVKFKNTTAKVATMFGKPKVEPMIQIFHQKINLLLKLNLKAIDVT